MKFIVTKTENGYILTLPSKEGIGAILGSDKDKKPKEWVFADKVGLLKKVGELIGGE